MSPGEPVRTAASWRQLPGRHHLARRVPGAGRPTGPSGRPLV